MAITPGVDHTKIKVLQNNSKILSSQTVHPTFNYVHSTTWCHIYSYTLWWTRWTQGGLSCHLDTRRANFVTADQMYCSFLWFSQHTN